MCYDTRVVAQGKTETYVCPPCGCKMDGVEFSAPGTCPVCGMTLALKQDLPFEPRELPAGANAFLTAGGHGHTQKRVHVHYYKPRGFSASSPILFVIPGAGRNGEAYRDAWVETAEAANIFVAALGYPEADYDFAAYQLGGVIENLVVRNMPTGPRGQIPSVVHLRDEDISFSLNLRREEWLFNDFDRLFRLIAAATGSSRGGYDMFGHSAGGQILHRLVLFHPGARAERIVAANAGFYTLPDLTLPQPIGLRDTGVTQASLAESFSHQLIVLLGEDDDGDEAGGLQIHTPQIDRQGTGRLARGRFFLRAGEERARAMAVSFRWSLRTVPNVGHDFRSMSRAAARVLYG